MGVGRVLGHEIAGTVVAAGRGVSLTEGVRIALSSDLPCQDCRFCLAGQPNRCPLNLAMGYQVDGGFAPYVLLPEGALRGPARVVPDGLPWTVAASAEPVACCLHGWEKVGRADGGTVVVFGAGPIGRILARLGRELMGAARIVIIEPKAARRELAAQDADEVFAPEEQEEISDTLKDGADLIFVACPELSAQAQALELIGRGGTLCLFGGLGQPEARLSLVPDRLHYQEGTITACHGATPANHEAAMDLLGQGRLKIGDLLGPAVDLADLPAAIEAAGRGVPGKVSYVPASGVASVSQRPSR